MILYAEAAGAASRAHHHHNQPYPSSSSPFLPISTFVNPILLPPPQSLSSRRHLRSNYIKFSPYSSRKFDSVTSIGDDDDVTGPDLDDDEDPSSLSLFNGDGDAGVEVEIEKIGKNRRRIRSKIDVEASLDTIWNILTDYERLADFIPGLAVSQLLEKRDNYARLFQIGQQNIAFGLKFNAKGIVECYEKELEILPFGQRRDIEFQMIEGDFQLFQGKWSIEQCSTGICEHSESLNQEFHTTLSYVVDVEPKLWLPVRLVEGRLCREINMNLSCIRGEAQRASNNTLSAQ